MLDNLKTPKLQTKVYENIMKGIQDGLFPQGKLPSEPKLAKMLGVSRPTVSIVLASMERDGLVNRKHGDATYVNLAMNKIKLPITEANGIFDLIRKSGHQPSIAWTKCEKIYPLPWLTERLEISDETCIYLFKRLFFAGAEPAIYVEENIPESIVEHPFDDTNLPDTLYEIFDQYCSKSIQFSIVDLIPTKLTREIANYLKCDLDEPILLTEETHLDATSKPVAFSKVYLRDRFVRFQLLRSRAVK